MEGSLRVIAKRRLLELAGGHGDCIDQVNAWYSIASKATWHDLSEVRQTFRHADIVGDKTVFNIKGNDYRLVVYILYKTQTIYIKHLLTHAEYDKGAWKA
jgi:mRNA interferase HigB